MLTNKFWVGKKVLVTGAAGFVGSSLSKKLTGLGAEVFGICRKDSMINFQKIIGSEDIKRTYFFPIDCDLKDLTKLRKTCSDNKIDTIFHLAAMAIVNVAAKQPLITLENNILTTLNVLEAARCENIQRVLVASSDKSYGDHSDDDLEKLPYQEWYTLRGLDMYSVSKVCCDMISQAYGHQFKFPVATIRCCNIYGPGDVNFTRLIPTTVLMLLAGKPPIIKAGHENVLREYIFIDDAVNAYLLIAEKIQDLYEDGSRKFPHKGKATYGWAAFNIGSYSAEQLGNLSRCGNIASVSKVISLLRSQIKDIAPIVVEKKPEYIEIPDEFLDSTKLLSMGFTSKTIFLDGLKKSVQWYRENIDKF